MMVVFARPAGKRWGCFSLSRTSGVVIVRERRLVSKSKATPDPPLVCMFLFFFFHLKFVFFHLFSRPAGRCALT